MMLGLAEGYKSLVVVGLPMQQKKGAPKRAHRNPAGSRATSPGMTFVLIAEVMIRLGSSR
jgi:hypothetical protein